jgi:hypothetical protein
MQAVFERRPLLRANSVLLSALQKLSAKQHAADRHSDRNTKADQRSWSALVPAANSRSRIRGLRERRERAKAKRKNYR